MKTSLLVVVAVLGCGGDPPAPTPPPLPAKIIEPMCGIPLKEPPGLRERKWTLATGSDVTLDMFAEPLEPITRRLATRTAAEEWSVYFCVKCPHPMYRLGEGWVGHVGLWIRDKQGDEDRKMYMPCGQPFDYSWPEGWIVQTQGGWKIHLRPPDDVLDGIRVVKTRAEVWLSQARRWAWFDVELDVDVRDSTLVLNVPAFETSDWFGSAGTAGFRLTKLSVNGQDTMPTIDHVLGRLVVPNVTGRARVHMRYEGAPTLLENPTQSRRSEMQLSVWLPMAPVPRLHPMDLTIHAPDDERLLASTKLLEAGRASGWLTYRSRSERDREPFVIAMTDRRTTDGDIVADRLELLYEPARSCNAKSSAHVRTVVDTLGTIFPINRKRVASIATFAHLNGQAGDDLVVLGTDHYDELCHEGLSVAHMVLAHELAHDWFGGQVRTKGGYAARWWESLAEYVATSVWDDLGAWQRRERANAYAAMSRDDEIVAMSQPAAVPYSNELSYGRGMLLLTALEDRIGKAKMQDVLRHFIRVNKGKLGSWQAVRDAVAAVAGQPASAWLSTWLDRTGAPDLKLRSIRREGDRIRGELVQSAEPPFVGTVQVAVLQGTKRLATHRVEFASAVTPLDVPLIARADRVALDPDSRLPRKYDPRRSDAENQTLVELR